MPTDPSRSFDLAIEVADRFAIELREVMWGHNDFSLPEQVVELLGQQLGVRLIVEDRDAAKNVQVFGTALLRAIAGAASWEHRRGEVIDALEHVLRELHLELHQLRRKQVTERATGTAG